MNAVFCFLEQTSSADLARLGAKMILKHFTVNNGDICRDHHVARQNLYEVPTYDHDFCKMSFFARF